MGCLEERGNEKACPHCQWEEGTPVASPLYLLPRTVLADQYLLVYRFNNTFTYLGRQISSIGVRPVLR